MDCQECGGSGFRDEDKPEQGICPCCAGTGMGNPNWDTDPDPFNNGGIPWDNGYSFFDPPIPHGADADEF